MRRVDKIGPLGALPVCVVLLASSVTCAETKAPATIVSPQVDTIVGREMEVVFETTAPGVPLLLVTAEGETVEWWVQPLAKTTEPGRHVVAAHFGNAKTPQGKPFQVLVLMAPNERTAEIMAKQQVFSQLPKGFVMSKPIRVLRKFEAEATDERAAASTTANAVEPVAAEIVRLENHARVARRQEVHGRLRGPVDPVILVRAAADGMWWVQDRVQRNAGGEFTVLVRFGNEKTPAGSEFHMLAVTPRSSSDAALFNVGDSLKELPKDAIVSKQMTLVLNSDEATGAE